MKKIIASVLFLLLIVCSKSASANLCEVRVENDFDGAGCTVFKIMEDVALTASRNIVAAGIEVYGATGAEVVSGDFNDALFSLVGNNINLHGLKLENTNGAIDAAAVLVAAAVTGIKIHSVTFVDCGANCVYIAGDGRANIYNNTFEDVIDPIGNIIFYADNGEVKLPPTIDGGAFFDLDSWELSLTAPNGITGAAEVYLLDGGKLSSIGSILENAQDEFTVDFDFADQLPKGTFHALITDTKTSKFGAGLAIDWMNDVEFNWGAAGACKDSEWFHDKAEGYGVGDYDDDGLKNAQEDLNANCVVDAGETDPTVEDLQDLAPPEDEPVNNLPLPPELISPEDGATDQETTLSLIWKETTDADGDEISYKVYICEDENFSGCSSQDVSAGKSNDFAGGVPFIGGIFLIGSLFAGKRKKFVASLALMLSLAIYSCGGSSAGDAPVGEGSDLPAGSMSYQVENLKSNTVYFWKIEATDLKESNESQVRRFTTKQ